MENQTKTKNFTPEFKAEVVLEALRRSSPQRLRGHGRSENPYWETFYHTDVSPETSAFGVRIFDTYGISTKKLILTLRNCGLNKRMHFKLSRIFGLN